MERNDSAHFAFDSERKFERQNGRERLTSAPDSRLPTTPIEIFRDLGMSREEIAAYFRRFPGFRRV